MIKLKTETKKINVDIEFDSYHDLYMAQYHLRELLRCSLSEQDNFNPHALKFGFELLEKFDIDEMHLKPLVKIPELYRY